jgi:hypothetical protein
VGIGLVIDMLQVSAHGGVGDRQLLGDLLEGVPREIRTATSTSLAVRP